MKTLLELLPAVAFLLAYFIPSAWSHDLYSATLTLMIASVVQVLVLHFVLRAAERRHLILLIVLLALGSATLFFHDKRFIMWKPTLVNWALATALLGSQFIGGKNLLQRLLESSVRLQDPHWVRLNALAAAFYFSVGAANLWVALTMSEPTWVQFRTVGLWALNIVFLLVVTGYLMRYAEAGDDADGPAPRT